MSCGFARPSLPWKTFSMDRAWRLVVQLENRLRAADKQPRMPPFLPRPLLVPRLQVIVMRMDDADRLAEFERWNRPAFVKGVGPIHIQWPSVDIFLDRATVAQGGRHRSLMPPVKGVVLRHPPPPPERKARPISALVEGDGRLYLAMDRDYRRQFNGVTYSTGSQAIGYVPLDEAGRPVGKTYRLAERTDTEFWDTVKLLPEPQLAKPLSIVSARYVAGKLCLATSHCGLLIFDPKTEKWVVFGPQQGLPKEGVAAIYPLDEGTLFCVGSPAHRRPVCYTLELPEGKVTLLHRERGSGGFRTELALARRQTASRLGRRRALRRLAGRGNQVHQERPWIALRMERPRGPRNLHVPRWSPGIYQHGRDGRAALRDPWGTSRVRLDRQNHPKLVDGNLVYGRVQRLPMHTVARWLPGQRRWGSDHGALLAFVGARSPGLVAWDPRTDTWYGPLGLPNATRLVGGAGHVVTGTRGGVWLPADDGVLFVSANDLLSAAKNTGRMMTTTEYRRRQRETIALMPPLDQAKLAIAMRQFDVAKQLLNQILDNDADSAQALLLMGYVHELWDANRPEAAH